MELTITEPTFLWLVGAAVLLELALLIIFIVLGWQLLKLIRFANEKSVVVGGAIDDVRSATHEASESLRSTSHHVAQFVNFTTSAAGIAKLFAAGKEAWGNWSGGRATRIIDDAIDDTPLRRRSRKK